jgi:hypothetical protein
LKLDLVRRDTGLMVEEVEEGDPDHLRVVAEHAGGPRAFEFTRGGEQVVLGARGPSISEVGGEPLGGQIFNVFTLRGGRIVRIDDYRGRSEALAAAGVADDAGWR